nr:organic solvent ABC transporter permease [Marinobacter adhaerens]
MTAVTPCPVLSQPRAVLALVLISLLLSGCFSGDSDSSSNDTETGQINALGISGLTYKTNSQHGKTDSQGRFQYYPGETLELKVGNLSLAEGVPAQEWVTPLEFFPDIRAQLSTVSVNDQGLSTHRPTEEKLISRTPLLNLTRFLIALNWNENLKDDEGIEIRDRVIQQLNAALPGLSSPIDFNVSEAEFTKNNKNDASPANQLLAQICFYPKGHEICGDPPTEAEIQNADERPKNENDWNPDIEYKQDLVNKRNRIFEAVRSLDDFDTEQARSYLRRELNRISTIIGNRYYLDGHIAKVKAGDTDIKPVSIRRIGGKPELADLEAITTRPQDVVVHSYSNQTAEVEYFVSGDAGGESEIITSFLPENTYRWVQKNLRVVITN